MLLEKYLKVIVQGIRNNSLQSILSQKMLCYQDISICIRPSIRLSAFDVNGLNVMYPYSLRSATDSVLLFSKVFYDTAILFLEIRDN